MTSISIDELYKQLIQLDKDISDMEIRIDNRLDSIKKDVDEFYEHGYDAYWFARNINGNSWKNTMDSSS